MIENNKPNEKFLSALDTLVSEFSDMTQRYHDKIDRLLEEEGRRLTESLEPPIKVGTRVYVESYRCEGTVIEAEVVLTSDNDDYYSPQSGVESLGPVFGCWVYTVQPDPTPVRKQARDSFTTTQPGILGKPGKCYPLGVVVQQSENDWDCD